MLNNWYPAQMLPDDARYTEQSVALLAARAKRAFIEYTPIRHHPDDPERIYRAIRYGPLLEVFGSTCARYRGPNTREPRDAADRRVRDPRRRRKSSG